MADGGGHFGGAGTALISGLIKESSGEGEHGTFAGIIRIELNRVISEWTCAFPPASRPKFAGSFITSGTLGGKGCWW